MEGSLREVIANQPIMNSPLHLILSLYECFLMKLTLSIFQRAIKFDFQFLIFPQIFVIYYFYF